MFILNYEILYTIYNHLKNNLYYATQNTNLR
jgi:hypothetical protein